MSNMHDLPQALMRGPGLGPKPTRAQKPRPVSKREAMLPEIPNPWGLSALQCEVLRLKVLGLDSIEIGERLCISFKTVATHLSRLKERMGVDSPMQAALLWDRHFRAVAAAAAGSAEVKAGRVYLAGPMTGMEHLNFPAFHRFAASLRASGYEVINPAEINADPTEGWAACMRKDIAQLVTCSHIALMPGWEKSRGASLEAYIANNLGMRAIYLTEAS